MERINNYFETNESLRLKLLEAINNIKYNTNKEPDYEPLFAIVPELREVLEFDYYHPAHPYNILEHSVRAAQMAENDVVKISALFHDIGKLDPNCQELVYNYRGPDAPRVMKTDGHEISGMIMAEPILRDLIADPNELELVLNLIRYHDSWGWKLFERDFDDMVEKFSPETIGFLFELQEVDLANHSEETIRKYLDWMYMNQGVIAKEFFPEVED